MKKTFNIPKTFFGFLFVSVFFWMLINLSKEYTTEINIDVAYTNLSIKKTIINTPIKKIPLLVKGSGFKLISTSLTNSPIKLNLEKLSNKSATNYFFLTKKLHSEVQNQLKSGIELISIQRDSIPVKIGILYSKEIPLRTDLDITFQLGHDLSTPITIKPNTILISGEKSLLDDIEFLNLEAKNLKNISESTVLKANIIVPENIKTEVTLAEINIIVDKFTEGEIEIPILIKNAPKEINIFPKKVKIIYKVGLKKFNKININSFKIECDYKQSKINDDSFLTPQLTKLPDSVSIVRMIPKKIDFLIHK